MSEPPLTPLGYGPPHAENAEVLDAFSDRTRRGAARMVNVCRLVETRPGLVGSLRSAADPYERLAGALIEVACAVRRGDASPGGGWGPGEANAVAGLLAELWSDRDVDGAAFAARHCLTVTKAAREDVTVLEEVITTAGVQVPASTRGWPNGDLLARLDSSLRAPLTDNTIATLEGRLAVLSGWVSLGGGNRLLTKLLKGPAAQRSLAVCCYALFSEPAGQSVEDTQRSSRDVLRLLGAGDLSGALAAAHRLTGIPVE